MEFTSTSRRWLDVAGRALVGAAVAATALVAFATPASAHTPEVKAGCKDGKTTLTVKLTKYNSHQANTVKVTDGNAVLADTSFATDYSKVFEADPTVDHAFTVTVVAWDDPKSEKGWSFVKRLPVEACVTPTTTTTTTTETTTTTTVPPTTTEETTTEAPTTTVAPTSPPPSDTDLANTGASLAVPLSLGALLLAGGGALLFMARRRRHA
jgi:LPXTG-motif cell wall-anchored protein